MLKDVYVGRLWVSKQTGDEVEIIHLNEHKDTVMLSDSGYPPTYSITVKELLDYFSPGSVR